MYRLQSFLLKTNIYLWLSELTMSLLKMSPVMKTAWHHCIKPNPNPGLQRMHSKLTVQQRSCREAFNPVITFCMPLSSCLSDRQISRHYSVVTGYCRQSNIPHLLINFVTQNLDSSIRNTCHHAYVHQTVFPCAIINTIYCRHLSTSHICYKKRKPQPAEFSDESEGDTEDESGSDEDEEGGYDSEKETSSATPQLKNYKDVRHNVTSLRIDAVVSKGLNISRK